MGYLDRITSLQNCSYSKSVIMEAARAAVNKITSRKGHTTDVDEFVNPAVTSETIKPHRHEETQEAIDREVHQDHYHTTVQPVAAKEVMPERHTHNLVSQVEREYKHDDEAETKTRVQRELQQFQNSQTVTQTSHSTAAAPTVAAEHVHHHVHETVQPVIHKETVQPEVVHTTVPIHEIHHGSAQHHGISALPMKTLDEFKQAGGALTGSKSHTHEEYEGAPRPYNEKLSTTLEKVLPGHHGQQTGMTGSHTTGSHSGMGTGAGMAGAGAGAGMMGSHTGRTRRGSSSSSSSSSDGEGGRMSRRKKHGLGSRSTGATGGGRHTGTGTSNLGTTDARPDSGYARGDEYGNQGYTSGASHGQQQGKPSMMDKLNPNVDADNDGKGGFMK